MAFVLFRGETDPAPLATGERDAATGARYGVAAALRGAACWTRDGTAERFVIVEGVRVTDDTPGARVRPYVRGA